MKRKEERDEKQKREENDENSRRRVKIIREIVPKRRKDSAGRGS